MAKPGLRTHRKFSKLVARLKGNEALALGTLEWIWLSCADATSDTFATGEDLEAAARWQGKRGQLVTVLKDCGFLDRKKGPRIVVHDYWDHCPEYVSKRRHRAHDGTANNGGQRTPPDAEKRPLRSRSDSPSRSQKITPRSEPPSQGPDRNRRKTTNPAPEARPEGPTFGPGSVGDVLKSSFWGQGGPAAHLDAPSPTTPIGAYSLRQCIAAAARYDSRKPYEEALKLWTPRLATMANMPGGLSTIHDLLATIANGNLPGDPKGVGRVNTPAAFLNKKTLEFIEQRRKGNDA